MIYHYTKTVVFKIQYAREDDHLDIQLLNLSNCEIIRVRQLSWRNTASTYYLSEPTARITVTSSYKLARNERVDHKSELNFIQLTAETIIKTLTLL